MTKNCATARASCSEGTRTSGGQRVNAADPDVGAAGARPARPRAVSRNTRLSTADRNHSSRRKRSNVDAAAASGRDHAQARSSAERRHSTNVQAAHALLLPRPRRRPLRPLSPLLGRRASLPHRRRHRVAERDGRSTRRTTTSLTSTRTTFRCSRTASSRTSPSSTRKQQPIALSLLLDSSASMEDKLPTLQIGGDQLRAAAEAERPRAGDRLRQPRRDPAGVHREPDRTGGGHPADGRRRLDVAAQRDLHLAQGAEEDQGRSTKTCAARRSSCSRTARTRRAWCRSTRCSISPSEARRRSTRSRCAAPTRRRKGFREAEFVMRQLAQETGGRAFFPAKIEDLNGVYAADRRRARQPVHARLHVEESRKRDGACRRIVVQIDRARTSTPRTKTGLLRPDSALNALPLLLYAAAGVAYAIHFARRRACRRPRRHDAAPVRRARRTPSSSGCRRWRCGTCRSRTPRAPSRRSSGC